MAVISKRQFTVDVTIDKHPIHHAIKSTRARDILHERNDFKYIYTIKKGVTVVQSLRRNGNALYVLKAFTADSTLQRAEIDMLSRLKSPHIITLLQSKMVRNRYFALLPMMDCDLYSLLAHKDALTIEMIKYVSYRIYDGIKYIHSLNIVHRDIKLSNILINKGGVIKLCDFGLATDSSSDTPQLLRKCGTLQYIAPELILGIEYGTSVDVYSAGVAVACLLFGAFIFKSTTPKELITEHAKFFDRMP
eukprot:154483_1